MLFVSINMISALLVTAIATPSQIISLFARALFGLKNAQKARRKAKYTE